MLCEDCQDRHNVNRCMGTANGIGIKQCFKKMSEPHPKQPDNPSSEGLKPCLKCGSQPNFRLDAYERWGMHECTDGVHVVIDVVMLHDKTIAEVWNEWNTRPTLPTAELEELRKDKARLDWVLKFCDIHVIGDSSMLILIPERPSIDKAMQGEATE